MQRKKQAFEKYVKENPGKCSHLWTLPGPLNSNVIDKIESWLINNRLLIIEFMKESDDIIVFKEDTKNNEQT
jgi:hypothetical protein